MKTLKSFSDIRRSGNSKLIHLIPVLNKTRAHNLSNMCPTVSGIKTWIVEIMSNHFHIPFYVCLALSQFAFYITGTEVVCFLKIRRDMSTFIFNQMTRVFYFITNVICIEKI